MIPLSTDLLVRSHNILSRCNCFDDLKILRAIFYPSLELAHWSSGLPEVNDKNERVRQTVAFLLSHSSSDGSLAFTIFLSVLRKNTDREDKLYDEINQLQAEVEKESSIIKVISVPIVVYAMKAVDADELFSEVVFNDERVAPIALNQFRRLKSSLGQSLFAQMLASYGDRREDWKPLTGAGNTIEKLICETIEHLNQEHKQWTLLQPKFKSDEFLEDDDLTRRQIQDDLGRLGGVIIVDGVSLFHPILWPKLLKARNRLQGECRITCGFTSG